MRKLIAAVCVFTLCSLTPLAQNSSKPQMEVVLLGTGYPAPDPDRAGPSTAVRLGEKLFVVDAGRGVVLRLAALQRRPSRIDAVFLTHLHSDHITGLPDLFATTWVMGREKPLELYGPEGVQQLVDGMKQFFAPDIHIRRDLTEMLPASGAEIHTHVVQPKLVYDDGELKITAFPVDHAPVTPAFGYRFEANGRTIVVSGDGQANDKLAENAKGADVLVQEVYLPEYFDRRAQSGKEKDLLVAARLKRYHSTPEQAAQAAQKAGVKLLVFTHVIPPDGEHTIIERAKKYFSGQIVVGKDLMRF